jgi:hypothetical protein
VCRRKKGIAATSHEEYKVNTIVTSHFSANPEKRERGHSTLLGEKDIEITSHCWEKKMHYNQKLLCTFKNGVESHHKRGRVTILELERGSYYTAKKCKVLSRAMRNRAELTHFRLYLEKFETDFKIF